MNPGAKALCLEGLFVDVARKGGSTAQYRCTLNTGSKFRTYYAMAEAEGDAIPLNCRAAFKL